MSETSKLTWEYVVEAATKAGARYPELVAAQWALESGKGKSPSGKNNYFGLKAPKGQGTVKPTTEFENGVEVPRNEPFLDFDSFEEGLQLLVKLWYKDYKRGTKLYKGANNMHSVAAAARHLQTEGYATNPRYAELLLKQIQENTPKAPAKPQATPVEKPLFTIKALQATFLKKSDEAAADLPEDQKVEVAPGKTYGVVKITEIPRSTHAKVVLAGGAGVWFLYMPHWEYKQKETPLSAVIDWNDFDARITKNLTVGEVLQWDKRRMPAVGSAVPARIIRAAEQFQRIRDAWQRPLGVTSWYRPEPINTQQGGVPGSQHTLGTAFDIYPVGAGMETFYQWIRTRWSGGLGDGRHRGFVHLDLRGNGAFVPGAGAKNYTWWTY